MKPYIGWLVAGILITVVLYLVFRKVPAPDNSALQHYADSLYVDNGSLRRVLSGSTMEFESYKDSTGKVIDSLESKNVLYEIKLDASQASKTSLAKQIQYYKAAHDSAAYDSACDLLAVKVLDDSIVIVGYQHNTDRLIFTMGDAITQRDSLIALQARVIVSDSVVIAANRTLAATEAKQLKKITSQAKVTAWLSRGLAVTALILGGILLGK